MKKLPLLILLPLLFGCGGEASKSRDRKLEIAQWEDRRSVGPQRELTTLFYHTDLEVRRLAVLAMGRIGDPAGLQELSGAETLDTSLVRADLAWAVGQLASEFSSELPEQMLSTLYRDTSTLVRRNVIDAMGHSGGAEVEQFLGIFGLLDGNPSTRAAAAVACGRLEQMQNPADLIGLCRDLDPEVRWRAAWAVWRLKETRAKGAMESALRDTNAYVRMYAARALAEIGDPSSADSLAPLLEDGDWRVRNNAALAMGKVGNGDRIFDLLAARLPTESHDLAAQTLAEAVGRGKRPKDVAALRALVARRSGSIFNGVTVALADYHPDSSYEWLTAMIADPRLGVAQVAYQALGRMSAEPARHMLATAYEEADETRRGFILSALAQYGWINVDHLMDRALESNNLVLGLTAAEVLGARADTASTRRLEAYWQRHANDSVSDFKLAALAAAGSLIDSQAVLGRLMQPWMTGALGDPDRLVRKAAIDALAKLGVAAQESLGVFNTTISDDNYDEIFRAFSRNPTATIVTDRGSIEIELRYDKAPVTVHNFVTLARKGFYEGIEFHRVVPNFVIQAGDPDGTGYGGPGYTIRSQYNDLEYSTGAVGMASSGKDTEGSQFFITHSPQPHLNNRYTVFGYVKSGQEVVDQIRQGDKIKAIQIQK